MQDNGLEVTPTKLVVPEETDMTLEDEQALTRSGVLPPSDKWSGDGLDAARMKRFIPHKRLTTKDEEELVRRGIVTPQGKWRI